MFGTGSRYLQLIKIRIIIKRRLIIHIANTTRRYLFYYLHAYIYIWKICHISVEVGKRDVYSSIRKEIILLTTVQCQALNHPIAEEKQFRRGTIF